MRKLILIAIAVIATSASLSAQSKGDFGVMPKMSIYTNTGTIVGIGVAARYNVSNPIRLEAGLTALLKTGCTLEGSLDVQYLFNVGRNWKLYPLAGIVINDIGSWATGLNVGGGVDYSVCHSWDVMLNLKWQPIFNDSRTNPVVISLGGCYKF